MKAKKNYRKKQGHRQPYTKVEITSIKIPGAEKKPAQEKKEADVGASTARPLVEKKETVKKVATTVKKEPAKTAAKKETVKKPATTGAAKKPTTTKKQNNVGM